MLAIVACGVALILAMAVLEQTPWVGIARGLFVVVVVVGIGLQTVLWRCPNCDAPLNSNFWVRVCRRCGVELR